MAAVAGSDGFPEQPILLLGAAGFGPTQREAITALLARLPPGGPRWRLVPFREADAWWVNGARVGITADGNVRVAAGLPHEHAIHLDMADVDRPVAFVEPITAEDFEPRCVLNLGDDASAQWALQQFEASLQLLQAQFALGAMVMRRGANLQGSIHHLQHQGSLLAVLDYRNGEIGIHPNATAQDLWTAEWVRRPDTARSLPRGFLACTPGQLVFAYARRTERSLLPERYRQARIYFRHAPRVPLRWLRDSQLLLLRELTAGPGDFANLRRRTGSSDAELALDLSCLYYTGAVTTTPSKAAASRTGEEAQESWLPRPSRMRDDAAEAETVAAPLEWRPRVA